LTKKVDLKETTDSAFHIYSCLWEPGKIQFFTDGVLLKEIQLNSWMQQFYQEPMVVILNNAVDHNYLDCIDNSKMPVDFIVDWIKIYQKTN
jgi:beta-glucanase (GH16 family)